MIPHRPFTPQEAIKFDDDEAIEPIVEHLMHCSGGSNTHYKTPDCWCRPELVHGHDTLGNCVNTYYHRARH